MLRIAILALFLLFATSYLADAISPQHVVYVDPVPSDTMIALQRGACERRCAVYKIVIFADGSLIWDGQYFVRRVGITLAKADPAAIKELVAKFQAANYFNMKNIYDYNGEGCNSLAPDGSLAITSIMTGGLSKTVTHDHRCLGAIPDKLTELENEIDKFAHSAQWIK